MKIFVIGWTGSLGDVIADFTDEKGYYILTEGEVVSYSSFKRAVDAARDFDVVILATRGCEMEEDDFQEGVRYLNEKFTGTVIVFAPSTSYMDARVEFCVNCGFDNVIRDVLTARIKANLEKIIETIPTNNNETQQSTLSDTKHNSHDPNDSTQANERFQSEQRSGGYEKKQLHYNTSPEIIVTKKVGIIGVLPRIGVTTQALMILNTLKSKGKSACYIQYHDSPFLNNMENYFTGVEKNNTKGCIVYEGIDLYKNPNLVLSQSYEYHIKDYGACEDAQVPAEFFNDDIRVIICGGTAEEVSCLTSLRTQLFMDRELIYVFSFIPEYEKEDIYDLMGDKTNTVLFAPYTPDSFKLTEDIKNIYLPVFGFEVEEENGSKISVLNPKRLLKRFSKQRG